jgi:hypothetical protein
MSGEREPRAEKHFNEMEPAAAERENARHEAA